MALSLEFSVLSWAMSWLVYSRFFLSSLESSLGLPPWEEDEPLRQTAYMSLKRSRMIWVIWKEQGEQLWLEIWPSRLALLLESLPRSLYISSQSRKWTICSSDILETTRSRCPTIFHNFLNPDSQLSIPIPFRIFESSSSFSLSDWFSFSHFRSPTTQFFCSPPSPCRSLRSLSIRLISSSMAATSHRRKEAMTGSDWQMSTDLRNSCFLESTPEGGLSKLRFLKPVELPKTEEEFENPLELFIVNGNDLNF